MTIDIIAAAQADRQTKLENIAVADDQVKRLSEYALKLRLDVIELDQFISRARGYASEGEPDTTAPKPLPEVEANSLAHLETPAEGHTVDQEPSTDGSGGLHDGLPVHPAKLFTAPIEPVDGARALAERRRRLGVI